MFWRRRNATRAARELAVHAARLGVRAFIASYNAEWLIEKNGHLSPHAMRRQHDLATTPMAA